MMQKTPTDILESSFQRATDNSIDTCLSELPDECIQYLKIIVEHAERQKGVLGVTLTSIVYKIYAPSQDIRKHQDGMENGYAGRSFDTNYVTPFLRRQFPHFAMAESAWLTRSLEQPHPYNLDYPGKIRSKPLKSAFLNTLDRIQTDNQLVPKMLDALMALMLESVSQDNQFLANVEISHELTIVKIIDAITQHIYYDYRKGVVGTARIPVLAIYAVYNLLMPEVKRYAGKTLAPLESHTSPDFRSKSLGDIEIKNEDSTCFEAIEIKHKKPITTDMIDTAYRKIKDTNLERYYILTTNEPNFNEYEAVKRTIEDYKKIHHCEIIVNGIVPSLKYYMRLISHPQNFIEEYTKWLEFEFNRASGIKREHLRVWQEIRQNVLHIE